MSLMCGINGIARAGARLDELVAVVERMNERIVHRGPDDSGIYRRGGETSVAMSMRRLSIIDLEGGVQPMYSDDGSIGIVFNGEIYNFRELRRELAARGHTFLTTSDTEVVLRLYEADGDAGFAKLDGMYGLSIHDSRRHRVVLARDFFGEKPLYYTQRQGGLIWASELKSITEALQERPPIDIEALNLYLRLVYVPSPLTIYEGVHKLLPNSVLIYDEIAESVRIRPIHQDAEVTGTEGDLTYAEARDRVRELVVESVRSRSIADVPLGTFLSGGVDSSVVSWCLASISDRPIDTFSIAFDKESFDESAKARTVAQLIGSNHHEFLVTEQAIRDTAKRTLVNFDEPFADSSSLAASAVAEQAQPYVKVALTGDGGDETFGGYNKYYMGRLNRRYTSIVPERLHPWIHRGLRPLINSTTDGRGARLRMQRLVSSIDYDDDYYWNIVSLGFDAGDMNDLLVVDRFDDVFDRYRDRCVGSPDSLTDYRQVDRALSLDGDMLTKVDRTSMQASLECRAPFLNREIWNFTTTLPESFLLRGWRKKRILKDAFAAEFPDGFLDKPKKGFGVPVGDWLRHSLRPELESYTSTDFLTRQGIFAPAAVQSLVDGHLSASRDQTLKVWTLYCFQLWYDSVYTCR